jgi:hypothetical protein
VAAFSPAAVPYLLLLSLVFLLQVAEHLRRRLLMARSCSSAPGSCGLSRLSLNLPRPHHQQQQQHFSLTGFDSWDLEQPSRPQLLLQQQQQLPGLGTMQCHLPAVPDHNLIVADTSQGLGQEQPQQQQSLQVQDDGSTELRQQLAWQALQQQQQQQQSGHPPSDSGQHLEQQQPQHPPPPQQQQVVLPLRQHHSPGASPAARRLVHSSSGSSNGSGSSSSGTGMLSLGLPRPIARTNSIQQLEDAAQQAAGMPAGVGAAADSAAAAAAVAYKQWHANVSVLFADVQGYTELADKVEPEQVSMQKRMLLLLHSPAAVEYVL